MCKSTYDYWTTKGREDLRGSSSQATVASGLIYDGIESFMRSLTMPESRSPPLL